jgi:MurNAc alpha-1-phosphate uridylyltransferase
MSAFTPQTAMVFAAGLGARMRPITLATPKPLVKVGGRTMLDHMLDRFAAVGVSKAVVNIHYLADQIENHLAHRSAPQIVVSDERAQLLDQGGGIKKVLPELGREPFFIANTDAVWIEDGADNLARLAAAWDPARMDILLLLAATRGSIGVDWPGDFFADPQGCLRKRADGEEAPYVYAGVGILKPELFAQVEDDIFRLAPFFFEAAKAGRLFGVPLQGQWLHVGTPQALGEAEEALKQAAQLG